MDDFLNYKSLENDSVGKEFLANPSHSSFDLATISTMTSLQGLETSLFHDQFSPVLGISSNTLDSLGKTKSKRIITQDRIINSSNQQDNLDQNHDSGTKLKNTNSVNTCSISEKKDTSIKPNFPFENGVQTLYRIESKSTKNLKNPPSLKINKIRVNDLEMKVIPSIKVSTDTHHRDLPTGFKNSDQLVDFFLGKVLRSSNSLFYIEKKLQQALYGAVFLAFELEELKKNENFERKQISHSIGSGTSVLLQDYDIPSFVFDPHKSKVAIKVSSMSLRRRKPSLKENMEAEIIYSDTMTGHKNVLEYSEIWQDSFKNIYIKMEYAEYEDLFEVMRRRRPLTENEARWLFSQIFNAVINLHNKNMALRDLSLENILMFSQEPHFFDISQDHNFIGIIKPGDSMIIPKITDPGQACKIFPKDKDEVSNIWKVYQRHPRDSGFKLQKVDFLFGKSFRPPEAYETGSLYDPTKVDVFCLGWMLLFTLTKYQPFETCRLITDNLSQNSAKNEGFINSIFGKIIPGNNTDNKITKMNGKSYVHKDQNWSLIVNGRILELFRRIKATNLSSEAQDLIENMLLPDYKERFSMQNVIAHPWLKLSSNQPSKYFTPIMASTLSSIKSHRKTSKQIKQSSNIVNPSKFFDKKDINNEIALKKNDIKTKFDESNPVDSANSQANILISKINNDYLCSMVKRTNDKLNMTRVNIARKKDSEVESLIRNLNSNSISDSRQINPNLSDNDVLNRLSVTPFLSKVTKNKKDGSLVTKNLFLSSSSSSSSCPQNATQAKIPPNSTSRSSQNIKVRKKNFESNFILDLWSFLNGGGGNGNTHDHIIIN
ncbi:Protein kinase domain protein [Cryptosporidium meleagridis]|uniref:Protein kinase domain protein n=1 Tax=Cryptosporidium meleagridis TaxID=93969 RepID=A0A2P4Z204_9CRYT|nr:Protein kinase domain protein [Cryptosporidium meleagridis]